jgi:hypothetical protein
MVKGYPYMGDPRSGYKGVQAAQQSDRRAYFTPIRRFLGWSAEVVSKQLVRAVYQVDLHRFFRMDAPDFRYAEEMRFLSVELVYPGITPPIIELMFNLYNPANRVFSKSFAEL